jgi:crossover junction endodeoxyribonuclease RuvC
MIILGIDPGLQKTGWGVIRSEGNALRYLGSGLIKTDASHSLAARLAVLHEGIKIILDEFKPQEAAVEETFVNENPRSTLKLGQARGVVLLAPAMSGLRVAEYTPNLIKKSVVGSGHAEKHQIQAMIGFLLPKAKFDSADESDALAIAITHANHRASAAIIAAHTLKVART